MSNITRTITADFPSNHVTDELIECISFLRILARHYPRHLDIAYEALQREYNLPPEMQLVEENRN